MAKRFDRLYLPLIAVAAGLAYSNSFTGQFFFDDEAHILRNPAIRTLWPPWVSMFAPLNAARPLIGLSLALNYAVSGLHIWSYHVMNLSVLVASAFALFGIVRGTLNSPRLRARFGASSAELAFASALIWAVHPLHTQAVTYIIQRFQSFMGLFYLLTLYASLRARGPHAGRWKAAAIGACALGMASKQDMLTAPIAVLLYDLIFYGAAEVKKRTGLYAGLMGGWIVLVGAHLAAPTNIAAGAGQNLISPRVYLQTEPGVILHYLHLAFWPDDLCFDYGRVFADLSWGLVAPGLSVLSLLAVTSWGLLKRKTWSYLGAWFFLTLALTSSVFPIGEPGWDYRMYLPLAAAVVATVLLGDELLTRLIATRTGVALKTIRVFALIVVAGALAATTFRRNEVYQSELALWGDSAAKRPRNPRALTNLGLAWEKLGDLGRAHGNYLRAIEVYPRYPAATADEGRLLMKQKKWTEAVTAFREALAVDPNLTDALFNEAESLEALGDIPESMRAYDEALGRDPNSVGGHLSFALLLLKNGLAAAAIPHYQRVIQLEPNQTEAYFGLGTALAASQKFPEASAAFEETLKRNPRHLGAHMNLALIAVQAGRHDEARRHLQAVLAQEPQRAQAIQLMKFIEGDKPNPVPPRPAK